MGPMPAAVSAQHGDVTLLGLPGVVLRPVREGNSFESTVEHLAAAIRLGVFAAGDRLPPERELAERLRVGRATLREAIAALRQAGLVTTSRGRNGGTVVVYRGQDRPVTSPSRLDAHQVRNALTFRRAVEPGTAALAATADLPAERRAALVAALAVVRGGPDDGERRIADARLHLAIATLTGSALVVEAVTQAQSMLGEMLAAIPVLRRNIDHSDAQHEEIVAAVLGGDAETARRVMEEHCDATSALLRGLIG
jgi:GntR family transcriptional regulator, transcriptional repressor for pyruvate dehydrogenase complex